MTEELWSLKQLRRMLEEAEGNPNVGPVPVDNHVFCVGMLAVAEQQARIATALENIGGATSGLGPQDITMAITYGVDCAVSSHLKAKGLK